MNDNIDLLSIVIDAHIKMDPLLLCKLSIISKTHKDRCNNKWKNLTISDIQYLHEYADVCKVCNEQRIKLNNIGICRFCMFTNDYIENHIITPFDFKHEWNIDPEILNNIPKISRYNQLFRKEEACFSRKDIMKALLIYFNGPRNLNNYYELKPSQRDRYNKTCQLLKNNPNNINKILEDNVLYNYIKKRQGSIKAIQKYIDTIVIV